MEALFRLWEKPDVEEVYMIAGWQQWADAGSISSGLPQYLIQKTGARKIGELTSAGYYLFQIPGTHHFLRPEIKLNEGYRESLSQRKNEFYYVRFATKGLVVFAGEEPHLNVERYAEALLAAVKELGVRRVAAVGGVYASNPYDKAREVSCIYSLRRMKEELARYAVRFSNYEGGATIGSYLVDRAEHEGIEFVVFYAFVPAYDFSQLASRVEGIRIENDYKAWYELMRRLNHMFDLWIDISDLEVQGNQLVSAMDAKIEELARKMPQLRVKEYLQKLTEDFIEMPFMQLDSMWERELGDILGEGEEENPNP